MYSGLLVLLCWFIIIQGKHFNGGTITWAPMDPYTNASLIGITLTQSYSWTYPYIKCSTNVPVSSGFGSTTLRCVVDCNTDGGYATKPISTVTDCISYSASLSMLSAERTNNLTLAKDAHFYLANLGTAWVSLNYPRVSDLEWSIVTFIDLRKRPDGFINTPPVVKIVSPQYVFVNTTMTIKIPVSDANAGDDVRCRWSVYTSGYRRRRRTADDEISRRQQSVLQFSQKYNQGRYRRDPAADECKDCTSTCKKDCKCDCDTCDTSVCVKDKCDVDVGCSITTTIISTAATTATTTATAIVSTTSEIIGTLKSTSSYPVRQAIDECGGICYPGSVPSTTSLSNCTLTFTGTKAGVWYGIALQVEDFINSSSTTPLSSTPIQFLIYVLPLPTCQKVPLILPINGCLEVQIGVPVTFQLFALNFCNKTIKITDIAITSVITGMSAGNLTTVTGNSSLYYRTLNWTPTSDQMDFQELCAVAVTSEMAQSAEYCEIFTVKNTSNLCPTTTTTTTSTTTSTETTSTTETTTTTTTTSTTTTASTTTTDTTTSTETTSTTETTTSTVTTSTTTSSTTSTTTSETTTTETTVTPTAKHLKNSLPIDWPLIMGLSLLFFLLAVCCACCCLYCCLWGPAGRRRRQPRQRSHDGQQQQPETSKPRSLMDQTWRKYFVQRSYKPKRLVDQNSTAKTLHSSDTLMVLTDIDEEIFVDSPPINVQRVKQSDLPKAKGNPVFNQIEHVEMQSSDEIFPSSNNSKMEILICLISILVFITITEEKHFDGGTITWAPIDPYITNSSVSIPITITQSYAWAYPTISCATNVPISTSGRSSQNWNLTCVVDCNYDGGYSTKPIDILTDCQSVSSSLGMMNSERSRNLTLTAGAHFYLANVGSAWVSLGYPAVSGLEWSIVTFIDLRLRPDGFLNTPPVASVVSPQYAIVNQTVQINIPVSDINAGDDVRCRWSTYTAGSRRRRRSMNVELLEQFDYSSSIARVPRVKRATTSCPSGCTYNTRCNNTNCKNTVCPGTRCQSTCCPYANSTASTTMGTTTTEIQETLKSTSSYPNRQALDECGGICFPNSVPNDTSLANCTITFTGRRSGVWYAIAIQVEDFINSTSTTALSSVPVQLLIYVLPLPSCPNPPVIVPFIGCTEVQIGVFASFNIYAQNLCDDNVAVITDIVVSSGITGVSADDLDVDSNNSSFVFVNYTWTPTEDQIGEQTMCVIAYTSEKVQSSQYCVTFIVGNSSDICITTTTTSTTTTSITTTSVTTTTTSATTSTTTSATTTTATTATTTKGPKQSINWPLILGLSLLGLALAVCCACCCLYWFLWGPAAKRRRRDKKASTKSEANSFFSDKFFKNLQRKTDPASPPSRVYSTGASSNTRLIDISITTDVDKLNDISSLVPVKRIPHSAVTVVPLNKITNINQVKIPKIPKLKKSTLYDHNNHSERNLSSAVTVTKVRKNSTTNFLS